jgi:hypothetical protein
MLRTFTIVLLVGGYVAAASPEPTLRSATLAKQLATALTERRLEAIAAQHPDEPDRFVAALFFPNAQLLVVSARHASPVWLQARLTQKEYRDVYLDLQASPVPNSSVFFQDMKADGLCSSRDQTADLLYSGSEAPTIFDGDWTKHNLSENEYEQELTAADERYSRLLEILLAHQRQT